MIDPHAGEPLEVQELGGLEPAVAGEDGSMLVDEEGIGEANFRMLSAICRICFLE